MYSREKDYCTIGGIVTLFVLIFGLPAVIIVWLFVGLFCASYRGKLYQGVAKYGTKVFGSHPESNPDYWVFYNVAMKHMRKDKNYQSRDRPKDQ